MWLKLGNHGRPTVSVTQEEQCWVNGEQFPVTLKQTVDVRRRDGIRSERLVDRRAATAAGLQRQNLQYATCWTHSESKTMDCWFKAAPAADVV